MEDFEKMVPKLVTPLALEELFSLLGKEGYQVVGPKVEAGAIVYAPLESATELPVGVGDVQDAGAYRLEESGDGAWFGYVVGPHSLKRYLFPPEQTLWRATRHEEGFDIGPVSQDAPRYAFFGVRACETVALDIQDRVFSGQEASDPQYQARRQAALVVAVNCARPGGSCFCASMNAGPEVRGGFDILLTEVASAKEHWFLLEASGERGTSIAGELGARDATEAEIAQARAVVERAADSMDRQMIPEAREVLARNLDSPHWKQVADRCLSCANCTMVCPTCFCSSAEDVTDLLGNTAERQRRWDSCFSVDFSYIHGGAIRRSAAARYRQWITHKLLHWHDQFGSSGCTGCGRCVTWCPVGIDITEEVRVLQDQEGRT